METIVFPPEALGKILGKNKTNIKRLEQALDAEINISTQNNLVEITIKSKKKDSGFNEYLASNILDALVFGFDIDTALLLRNTNYTLRKIDIKAMVKKARVKVVSGRIIGRQGKTKQLLEKASECDIVLRDHIVGILGKSENVELASHSILTLIRGAPQSKAIGHLERDMARQKALETSVEDMIER